ncbi:MAG TPA: S8 family serine peptidase [Thermoanaerobaculia bacterium]|jgi:subtilisin family serine protease|nr:S8 family serine peptidase [Thermoanaerobaculia bacterium]
MATKKGYHFRQAKYVPPEHLERLDPELWQAILRRDKKLPQKPRISFKKDGEVWLDVILKLKDRRQMPKLLAPGMTVENPDPTSRHAIVTGAVRDKDIEALRQDPNVLSLKGSRIVGRAGPTFSELSHAAIEENLEGQTPGGPDGTGVIVGVVDFGCDFVHPNFRDAAGQTRLLYLWDQAGQGQSSPSQPFSYGRELSQERLQNALNSKDPYANLNYEVSADAHGTPVLDIAAGNGRGTDLRGMAPNAHLIFVDLGAPLGDSPLNDRRLLDAVGYIFAKADEQGLPAVVNLSLGLYAGPHDGTALLETGLDWLASKPRRAIVVAAGNAGDQRIHFEGAVEPQAPVEIEWEVFANGHEDDECEIWYDGSQKLSVTLLPPDGIQADTRPVALQEKFKLISDKQQLVGHIIHEQDDPNNGDNQIKIRIPPLGKPKDVWKIKLATADGETGPVPFHAWIERDDLGQSRFRGSSASSTLGSLSCGRRTMVVGAQGLQEGIAAFSGAGPTRDGRFKPEVSAPGVEILGAKARASSTRVPMRGTSAAAPSVTGVVALLFQVQPSLSATHIYRALTGRGKSVPTSRSTAPQSGAQATPVSIDAAAALRRILPASVNQPSTVASIAARPAAVVASTNGGNGQLTGDGSWQAQLMQSLLSGTAAGKMRVTFEVESPDPH